MSIFDGPLFDLDGNGLTDDLEKLILFGAVPEDIPERDEVDADSDELDFDDMDFDDFGDDDMDGMGTHYD